MVARRIILTVLQAAALPSPGAGNAYIIDETGAYIVDDTGAYLIAPVSP